jgi:hypothetical protein
MSFMRRIGIAAAAAAMLALLAISVGWYLAAQQVQTEIAGWTERQRNAGIFFTHGEMAVGGFPLWIELTIPDPVLADADGRRRWEGPAIHARAPSWRPDRLDYTASGRHRYRFTGSDGLPREIVLDMLEASGALALDEDRVHTAALEARSVRITGTAPGEVIVGRLAAELRLAPEKAADLRSESGLLSLLAEAVSFAGEGAAKASSEPVRSLELRLAVTGPIPWGEAPDALQRWREAGGTLELRRAGLSWSTLAVDGEGTLALDDEMRPEGAVTLRVAGLQPTLQKLTAEGVLAPEDAELIQLKANDLASPDVGDPGRMLIAISAQDGRLTVRDRTYRILHPVTAP